MENQNAVTRTQAKAEMVRAMVEKWDNSDSSILCWMPSLMSVAGLIIECVLSKAFTHIPGTLLCMAFGHVVCHLGHTYGKHSVRKANRMVSSVMMVLCVLMTVIHLFTL